MWIGILASKEVEVVNLSYYLQNQCEVQIYSQQLATYIEAALVEVSRHFER